VDCGGARSGLTARRSCGTNFRKCRNLEERMKCVSRAAVQRLPGILVLWLAAHCAGAACLLAQTPANPAPSANAAATSPLPAGIHGVVDLDGPWRFQIGDDPGWAEPGFDDSKWQTVTLDQTLNDQGIDSYSGYAWYRLRLEPQELAQFANESGNQQLDLLLTGYSIGQLQMYLNGAEIGHTRGLTDNPSMYLSPPLVAHLAQQSGNGPAVLAIRTWAGAGIPIHHGLLSKVELGSQDDIAGRLALAIDQRWDQHIIAGIVVTLLFVFVAVLGATLYFSQRHHAEYLWLALMCLSVAFTGSVEAVYQQGALPYSVFNVLDLWAGRIFMAVTLEFVLRFAGSESRRVVRIVQISVLVIPVLSLLNLDAIYQFFSITAEVVFCGMVCVLLYRAWRRGLREAGVMLVPFFLAATADSVDTVLNYAAEKHWVPEHVAMYRFHLGPIEFAMGALTYAVFLASIIAVILYRFVRVSQDEQKSTAEISAARSVQALLIPTQLPSNKNFMLESAYLPASGVGGDFFQVLPLKDDSLMIVVGDVSGKGLQAAMNASTLVGALRNELAHEPATVLDHLNRVLLGAVPVPGKLPELDAAPCFATCLCARVYPDGRMTIANAGHLSPYRDGREMELAPGLPLGVIANISYEQAAYQLNHGERIIFLSDGVVEATNDQGELFGFERTQQVSNEPARYIAQTAKRFGQNDDITVVSLYMASKTAHRANQEAVVTG
jgi:sigma-B regulation protein RsbU (phosphoserine phosphatase)